MRNFEELDRIPDKASFEAIETTAQVVSFEELTILLQERGKQPLNSRTVLSAAEERMLAQGIEFGKHAEAWLDDDSIQLPEHEVEEMTKWAEIKQRAFDEFVLSNQGLVHSIARRFIKDSNNLEDLVQVGNTGLITAVHKFDWRRGFKFSTHATWWIRQAIQRGDTLPKSVKIPAPILSIHREVSRYLDTNPHSNEAEAFEVLGYKDSDYEKYQSARQMLSITSLNKKISNESDGGELGDLIAGVTASGEEDFENEQYNKERIQSLLGMLGGQQREALLLVYGLDGRGTRTHEETAQALGVTRDTVSRWVSGSIERLHDLTGGDEEFHIEELPPPPMKETKPRPKKIAPNVPQKVVYDTDEIPRLAKTFHNLLQYDVQTVAEMLGITEEETIKHLS